MDYDGPEIVIERKVTYGSAVPKEVIFRVYLAGRFVGTLYDMSNGLAWMAVDDARSTRGPLSILAEAMAASVQQALKESQ